MGEVGLEVGSVFEADVEADDAVRIIGTMRAGREIVGDGEAGDAGPAIADFEELERIHEGVDLFFCEVFSKDDGEDACRAREIALEKFVARARRNSRMED